MKRLKQLISFYFRFDQKEEGGVLVLIGLLLLVFVFAQIGGLLPSKTLQLSTLSTDSLQIAFEHTKAKSSTQQLTLRSPFDPNNILEEDWVEMGIPQRLAQTISYYVSKGGRFYRKTDLLRICGMRPELYQQLEPFVLIPQKNYGKKSGSKWQRKQQQHLKKSNSFKRKKSPKDKRAQRVIIPFEINTSDTAQLSQITGIGPVLSQRIIRYRSILGGFVHWDQLSEVYGLERDVIARLKEHASLDPHHNKKLNINTATFYQLKKHPYIKYKLAKVIVNYRQQHGPYSNLDDLLKIQIITQQKLEKLKPYLTL